MRHRCLIALELVLACFLCPRAAIAQTDTTAERQATEPATEEPAEPPPSAAPLPPRKPTAAELARAKEYFEAGRQAFSAGHYVLAARAYEEAYALAGLPEIAFSIAQAHRLAYTEDQDVRHVERAIERYREYLARTPSGRRRPHAILHLAALEQTLEAIRKRAAPEAAASAPATEPRLTQLMISARVPRAVGRIDAGELVDLPFAERVEPGKHRVHVEASGFFPANVEWLAVEDRLVLAQVELVALPARLRLGVAEGARVHLDGRWVGTGPLRHPIDVAAGDHALVVTRRGHRTYTKKLRLARGETTTIRVPNQPTSQRVASYWLLGGAAVGAVAGGVTTTLALFAESDARALRDTNRTRNLSVEEAHELSDALDRRNGLRTASIALFAGGAVLGIAGTLLHVLDSPGVETIEGSTAP